VSSGCVDPQQVVREKCDFRSSEVAITERSVFAATRRKNALRRTLQPSQEQTGVVACAHKDGVDRIASGSGEGFVRQGRGSRVADDRFDNVASSQLSLDYQRSYNRALREMNVERYNGRDSLPT